MKMKYFNTVAQACAYTGAKGELTFVTEDCTLRIHDGCTCGGKILNAPFDSTAILADIAELQAQTDNVIVSGSATEDELTLVDADGTETVIALTHPPIPDEEGVYIDASVLPVVDIGAETLTFTTATDEGEVAGAIVVDLAALFAALTSPTIITDGTVTSSFNAATNAFTITGTPHTEDTFFRTLITGPDANGAYTATETDVDGNVVNSTVIQGGSVDTAVTVVERACEFDIVYEGTVLQTVTKREEAQVSGGSVLLSGVFGGLNFPAGAANNDVLDDEPYRLEFVNPSSCRPAVLKLDVTLSAEFNQPKSWYNAFTFHENNQGAPTAEQQLNVPKRVLNDVNALANDRTELVTSTHKVITLPPNGTYWVEYFPRIYAVTVGATGTPQILNGAVAAGWTYDLQ